MPVTGSIATASCTKQPSPVSGTGLACPNAGTSNTQPCCLVYAAFVCGPLVFSSHVSQLPHGVGPPAQLLIVPAMLADELSHCPVRGLNARLVVPPMPTGS